jgi:hypothetical protein
MFRCVKFCFLKGALWEGGARYIAWWDEILRDGRGAPRRWFGASWIVFVVMGV